MKAIIGNNPRQTKRLVVLALFAAVALAGSLIAKPWPVTPPKGWFQHVESGINHASMVCDSHHICAVGMNSVLGHCITTIVLTAPNRGLIEYQSQSHVGDIVYGVVTLTPTSTPGVTRLTIQFTGGKGRYTGATGTASGTMDYGTEALHVKPFIGKVGGYISIQEG